MIHNALVHPALCACIAQSIIQQVPTLTKVNAKIQRAQPVDKGICGKTINASFCLSFTHWNIYFPLPSLISNVVHHILIGTQVFRNRIGLYLLALSQ